MKSYLPTYLNYLLGCLLLLASPALAQNLALQKQATASSENGSNSAAKAIDGDRTTRWESVQGIDPQSIVIDLGSLQQVDRIRLFWETAFASAFTLAVSADNSTWTTVVSESANTATTTEYAHLLASSQQASASVRYVRLTGTARATQYGYSLWEFEVYSYSASDNLALGKQGTAATTQSGFPVNQAFDDNAMTRWGSEYDEQLPDSAYLYVDLQRRATIRQIGLYWETAYAIDYKLEVSDDAQTWHGIKRVTGNTQQTNVLEVSATGRYVRMHPLKRATNFGYSLWEFVVLGTFAPLPVTLTSFGAAAQGPDVRVSWTTASEQHNAGFEVQRSADGQGFITLARIAGAGTSLTAHTYQYLDAAPLRTSGYYRLQQFDTPGTFTYSPVVVMQAPPSAASAFLGAYPNPTGDRLTLSWAGAAPTTGRWYLASATGQVVHAEALPLPTGPHTLVFDLQAYPAGRYVLTIEAAGEATRTLVQKTK
ncbi:MAG: discoidin domain-containing protein [Janthinobacterium lividum]